jgi:hypothetical protein
MVNGFPPTEWTDDLQDFFMLVDQEKCGPWLHKLKGLSQKILFIGISFKARSTGLAWTLDMVRDLGRLKEPLPPLFGFAQGFDNSQLFAIRATGLPCFTVDPNTFTNQLFQLFLKTDTSEEAGMIAGRYFESITSTRDRGIVPRFIGVEIDEFVERFGSARAIERVAYWLDEFQRVLTELAHKRPYEIFRPVSPPNVVMFTSSLEDHECERLRRNHTEIVNRRSAEQHGIWSIRHFVVRAVQSQPSLVDPLQFPFLGNPPLPRPEADPREYATYPAGVSPSDLAELFKMIRQEADSSLPRR